MAVLISSHLWMMVEKVTARVYHGRHQEVFQGWAQFLATKQLVFVFAQKGKKTANFANFWLLRRT